MSKLKELRELLFERTDTEATDFPFWYVAEHWNNRVVMVSHGIWFSRASAAEHFKCKRHRYGKKAFVYCDSACDSITGLRKLYKLAEELPVSESELHFAGRQDILDRLADATGLLSPNLDEIINEIKRLRSIVDGLEVKR